MLNFIPKKALIYVAILAAILLSYYFVYNKGKTQGKDATEAKYEKLYTSKLEKAVSASNDKLDRVLEDYNLAVIKANLLTKDLQKTAEANQGLIKQLEGAVVNEDIECNVLSPDYIQLYKQIYKDKPPR